MFRLKNWSLLGFHKNIYASGKVFDNPKFCDGQEVTTNIIVSVQVEDEIVITTKSGSVYALDRDSIDCSCAEETGEKLKALGLSSHLVLWYLEHREQAKNRTRKLMSQKLKPGDLYITMAGDSAQEAYYMKGDKSIMEVGIFYRAGMFSDNVVLGDYDIVDFRYFPRWHSIQIYCWSDGINRVIINNIGENFSISDIQPQIVCEHGSETVIRKAQYERKR